MQTKELGWLEMSTHTIWWGDLLTALQCARKLALMTSLWHQPHHHDDCIHSHLLMVLYTRGRGGYVTGWRFYWRSMRVPKSSLNILQSLWRQAGARMPWGESQHHDHLDNCSPWRYIIELWFWHQDDRTMGFLRWAPCGYIVIKKPSRASSDNWPSSRNTRPGHPSVLLCP